MGAPCKFLFLLVQEGDPAKQMVLVGSGKRLTGVVRVRISLVLKGLFGVALYKISVATV